MKREMILNEIATNRIEINAENSIEEKSRKFRSLDVGRGASEKSENWKETRE